MNHSKKPKGNGVQRVYCPDVVVPTRDRKRIRGDMGWEHQERSSEGKRSKLKDPKLIQQQEREEFLKAFKSMKSYSAISLEGLSKKKYKEEKLTALGAPRVKEQTMPFKMKMGILAGRKRRELNTSQVARESGVVLARPSAATSSKQKHSRERTGRVDLDVPVKNGVFHLSKKRLPSRLL